MAIMNLNPWASFKSFQGEPTEDWIFQPALPSIQAPEIIKFDVPGTASRDILYDKASTGILFDGIPYDGTSSDIFTGLEDFVTSGGKWGPSGTFGTGGGTVTWSIAGAGLSNASADPSWFSGSSVALSSFLSFDYTAVLTQAFAAWSAVANINFVQVADGGGNLGAGPNAYIRIGGGFIDGRPSGNSILASAWSPFSAGNAQNIANSGDVVFDSGEGSFWNASSFLAVATHEIGHSLGLKHTSVSGSLMEPFYNPSITTPQADDIAGIRSIYGTATVVAGSVTISDVTITEGNAGTQQAIFTLTRSGGTAAFSLHYATADNTAVAGSDYVAASGTASFASGAGTTTVSVTINGDTTVESNETFLLNLSAATNGATITDGQGVGTIVNDDSATVTGSVSISDVTITEGDAGTQVATFTATRTGGTGAFAVNYATANNSALAGSDYVANSGTLSFASGVNVQTIQVTINGDKTVESNETFFVNLSGATNGATVADGQGVGTIVNDDAVASGDDYADSFTDFTAPFGQVTVGSTSTGDLETVGDRDWFRVTLAANAAVTIDLLGADSSSGTVPDPYLRLYDSSGALITQDDDSGVGFNSRLTYTPSVAGTYYISASAYADSFTGTYRINVSGSSAASDDFRDSLTDTTAPFGSVAINGSSTGNLEVTGDRDWFQVQLTAGFNYTINIQGLQAGGGSLEDPYLRLHNSSGGLLAENDDIVLGVNRDSQLTFTATASGTYYIQAGAFDDDYTGTYRVSINGIAASGSVSINDVTVTEGDNGTKLATFTIARTGGTAAFDVNYGTSNGTATDTDNDFVGNHGTLHFGANVNTQTVAVTINGDTKFEPNEFFYLLLGGPTNGATVSDDTGIGSILNDDAPTGSVSINDVAVSEGNSGTRLATFTVTRSGGTAAFDVNYGTTNGSATNTDSDFASNYGTLHFGAGVNTQTVAVTINGDLKVESNETFFVLLGSPTNGAAISDDTGLGTIINDDFAGSVAINNAAISEGNSGTRIETFTVTRSGGTAAFDINYGTSNGSATNTDGDFVSNYGTLHFADGVNTQTISVAINGDTNVESDETFFVFLGGPTNGAIVADDTGIGTIANDDTPVKDFNGDGKTDILWRSDGGTVVTWNINDGQTLSNNDFGVVPTNWKITGTGDFNGDHKSDLLWRSDAGTVVTWNIDDNHTLSTNDFGVVPNNWKTVGTGDFNGDGKSDLLWRSDAGSLVIWDMNDGHTLSTNDLGVIANNWKIAGTGDFNGDGKTDLLWRSDAGTVATWDMNDGQVLSTHDFGVAPNTWKIAGIGDFNGDGKSDLLWRSDVGTLVSWDINDGQVLRTNDFGVVPNNWHIAGTGDFNGDSKSDFLWRSDAGTVVTWDINDAQVLSTHDFGVVANNWHII